jgi:hypothetical protein
MSHQGSFSMRSTHRFVTNDSETVQGNNVYNTTVYSSTQEPEKKIDHESHRKKGSVEGMAIRTSGTSQEDYF